MSFEKGIRRGKLWTDLQTLDTIVRNFNFRITGKNERDFENSFSSVVMSKNREFTSPVITQQNKDKPMNSVYCFGKKHRPDLTLGENGVAIEIKYIHKSVDGVKKALGQLYFYRVKYKFAVLILVLSEHNKNLYEKIAGREEKDLEDIIIHLADNLNIFTYIVPSFKTNSNIKKSITFDLLN